MIVVNEDNFIHGNTVLQPEYRPSRKNERHELNNKNRNINKDKHSNARINNKVKIIRNIVLIFIVGLTLVGRYCVIYDMQMELNKTKHNINEINKENESLKVELVKYNNLQYIEDTAANKLQMVLPDKSAAVYTDLDKENVKIAEKKELDKVEKQNIWTKLRKILF